MFGAKNMIVKQNQLEICVCVCLIRKKQHCLKKKKDEARKSPGTSEVAAKKPGEAAQS